MDGCHLEPGDRLQQALARLRPLLRGAFRGMLAPAADDLRERRGRPLLSGRPRLEKSGSISSTSLFVEQEDVLELLRIQGSFLLPQWLPKFHSE